MARWKAHVKFLLSVAELLFLSLMVEALQGKMCQNSLPSGGGGSVWPKVIPMPVYWYHSKGNWLRYNYAADIFYILKLCSRLFVLYYRNCPKADKFRHFIPILRKLGRRRTLVDGSLESPCRVLVKCNWTSFSISYGWGATRQMCPNALPSGGGSSLGAKISGEGVVSLPTYWYHSKGNWLR